MLHPVNARRLAIFSRIDRQIEALDWPIGDCVDYLRTFYGGRTSRHQLSDDELEHFCRALRRAVAVLSALASTEKIIQALNETTQTH